MEVNSNIAFKEIDLITQKSIQHAAQYTADKLTDELQKHGMIQLEPTAYEATEDDIETFKFALKLLSDETVSLETKKDIAQFITTIQRALKKVQDQVSEREFLLFYQHKFNQVPQRKLSIQFGVDIGTVRRAVKACITQLSIYLYPNLYISELME